MFLLTTNVAKKDHIYAKILFVFLKAVLNRTTNAFNTKYCRQTII